MFLHSQVSKAVKFSALYAFGTISFISPPPIYADNTHNKYSDNQLETIEVTGSRIQRPGAVAPSPITSISGADLIKTGAVSIGEALNALPALANTLSMANSGYAQSGTSGLNYLDLRGLGTSRTLVLIDGKRHVAAYGGDSAVDINTIPTNWVERVEIITGGASAVYGADAVTGVVNFIMKKNIEGLDISATGGWAGDNSHHSNKLSISFGDNFLDDKLNAGIAIEYSKQSALRATDREQTAASWKEVSDPDGKTQKIWVNGGYWSLNNAGVVVIKDPADRQSSDTAYTFDSQGQAVLINRGDQVDGGKCWGDCDYINLREFIYLQPAFDRVTVNAKSRYNLTDTFDLYLDAKWSQTHATTDFQPIFTPNMVESTLDIANPYIPEALKSEMEAANMQSVTVSRFMTDIGNRYEENKRTTQRYVFGLQGDITHDWSLDVYALHGQTQANSVRYNGIILENFKQSIDAVKDPVTGRIICNPAPDNAEPIKGCVPSSILGEGVMSAEARDFMLHTIPTETTINQTVISGSLATGNLLDLWAGPVGLAAGMEYRREATATRNDPLSASGATSSNISPDQQGSFEVREVFTELLVPLITGVPAFEEVTLSAAARYAHYSTIGDATSWKLGLDWTVFNDLRIRSTVSQAIRAPNIGEFYDAQTESFKGIRDGCKASELANVHGQKLKNRVANCAALGIPQGFDSDYDTKGTLPTLEGGNDQLKPEVSESITAGFVYQPGFIDGLTLTADYWQIDITDAIDVYEEPQLILDQCLDSAGINNKYCREITRDAVSHEITNIMNNYINTGRLNASGVDLEVGYDIALAGGYLRTNLLATYLLNNDNHPDQDGTVIEKRAGTTGYAHWQGQIGLGYSYDRWHFGLQTRYLQGVDIYTSEEQRNSLPPSNIMTIGDYFISTLSVAYRMESGFGLSLGVDNLFDRDLPLSHMTGTEKKDASYDNIGRFVSLTASYQL